MKQPGETLKSVILDFAPVLLSGETVSTVAADDTGTGIVTSTGKSGATAMLTIAAGSNGEQIPVAVIVTGSAGSVRRATLLVVVQDPLARVAPVVIAPSTIVWKGDWSGAAGYKQYDLVRSGGRLWMALRTSLNVTPAEGADWTAWTSLGTTAQEQADIAKGVSAFSWGDHAGAGYESAQVPASQAEAEAGTEAAVRSWSPARVWQAIAAKVAAMFTNKSTLDKIGESAGNPTWNGGAWPGAGNGTWGNITGTLSSQTDLQNALDGKAASGHAHAGVYEPANANIQSHISATGNVHGMTAAQIVTILNAALPEGSEFTLPVRSAVQPTLDSALSTALTNMGLDPAEVVWINTAAPDTTKPVVTAFSMPATATSLTVAVSTFTATDNSGTVTGYLITESSSAPAAGAAGWTGSAPADYAFSQVGARTAYPWAKDAAGNVSLVFGSPVTVTITTAPNAATSLYCSPGDTLADCSWTVSADDSTHSAATSQRLYWDTDSSPFDSATYQDFANNSSASHQVTGLTNDVQYWFGVRATNSAGSTNSDTATATPAAGANQPPSAPVISQSAIAETTATISLDTISTDSDGTVASYSAYKGGVLAQSGLSLSQGSTYQYTGLSGGTSYALTLKAVDDDGALSNASNTVTALTISPVPAGLAAAANGQTQLDVSWSASTGAATYTLQESDSEGGSYADVPGGGQPQSVATYSRIGLTAGTTKWFRVRANNASGSSAYSAAVSGTTTGLGPFSDNFSDGTLSPWAQITNPADTDSGTIVSYGGSNQLRLAVVAAFYGASVTAPLGGSRSEPLYAAAQITHTEAGVSAGNNDVRVGLSAGATNQLDGYEAILHQLSGTVILRKYVGGVAEALQTAAYTDFNTTPKTFRLEVNNGVVRALINGSQVVTANDSTYSTFTNVNLRAFGQENFFDDVVCDALP